MTLGRVARVAQCNLICQECGINIKPEHKYYWKQVKKGFIIHVLRICERCKEGDKLDK